MVTCTGHIGIHEGADGRTYVRTYVVRTDVDDVMAIKPNFLTSMGYHIFLTMLLRARGAPLITLVLVAYLLITSFLFKTSLTLSFQELRVLGFTGQVID